MIDSAPELRKKVTIIVPIYGDWPSLKKCIESLITHVDRSRHTILLVNDCGPDVETIEKNIQRLISNMEGFIYYRNPQNLGFVGTCNRAVSELDQSDNEVLLLNSDTEVTDGFLSRMLAALYTHDQKIGIVSPRSNNATICTLPISAITQKGVEPQQAYNLFRTYKDRFPMYSIAPTAHGFCMLIRRTLIAKYGLFDEVFGKGYGEEVDFCRRVQIDGWSSVICHGAFVFHLEAKSFSLETKAQLLLENNKIIHSRYPNYKQSVTDYIHTATKLEEQILGKGRTIVTAQASLKGVAHKTLARSDILTKAARIIRRKLIGFKQR